MPFSSSHHVIMFTKDISAIAKVVFLISTLLLGYLPSVLGQCGTTCKCEGAIIDCTCNNTNQNLSLFIFNYQSAPSKVYISDCNTVVLFQWNKMLSEPLKTLDIRSVRRIEFNQHVIMGQNHIDSIVIRDSGMNLLGEYALGDAQHLKKLVFINVTIPLIQKRAFYMLQHIKEFTFINCTIGHIQSHAFEEVSHVDKFKILNTKIKTLESDSFEMKHVRQITFSYLSVSVWGTRAFVPKHVHHVEITHSRIQELNEEGFAAENVSMIVVHHSRIIHVQQGAFAGLNDVGSLVMANNSFSKAYKNSFVTDAEVTAQQNRFSCRLDDICSFLGNHSENANNPFITNSTCMSPKPEVGKPLISFSVINVDDEDLCSAEGSGESVLPTAFSTNYETKVSSTSETDLSIDIEYISTPDTPPPPTKKEEEEEENKNDAFIVKINSNLILFAMLALQFAEYIT